jgi:hypothetical protein
MLAMSFDRASPRGRVQPRLALLRGRRGADLDATREKAQDISLTARVLDADQPVAVHRRGGRPVQLIYALYDLTFPVDLSRRFIAKFARRDVPHRVCSCRRPLLFDGRPVQVSDFAIHEFLHQSLWRSLH